MKPQKQANKVFQFFSILQIILHLIVYGAAFIKLILIEKGGYYDIGTLVFIGISIVSLPLMVVTVLLAKFSSKLSTVKIRLGYVLHGVVLAWSIFIIYVSYLM